ncbi:MAG TPA: orotate phosphoribosyltransferase [Acidimicrobiia bacterium]|nr:orotate phosphoribosyltransferase [Acidimicrobiia bacterium]
MRPAQHALAAALREHAIREGDFTLSSGRRSRWYLDGRMVTFRGDCVEIVGGAIVEALADIGVTAGDYDAVGGLAVGAVPVAVAVTATTGHRGFAVRKEAKGHGVGGRMAGPLEPGDRVLVVEDTATTGASLLDSLDAVTEFGCEVVAASLLLDRGGELGPELERRGVRYAPVLTAPDLGYEFGS